MSNMKFKGLLAGAVVGATLAFAMPASAATVNCPGTAVTTDREFTIDSAPAATCLATGVGNINGNPSGGNADPFLVAFPGYTLIDKSDSATAGISGYNGLNATSGGLNSGLAGTISLTFPTAAQSPAGQEYFNFAVGFKTGQGELDPDWAVFGLPSGLASFDWSISGSQALSHTNLYAQLRDTGAGGGGPGVIPLPAGLPLILTGLGVFGALRLRKRKTA